MNDHRRRRALAALTLLVLFASVSNVWSLRGAGPDLWSRHPTADAITANERRFAILRGALPAHGVVGYLASVPPDKLFSTTLGVAHFYIAQYALAPVIVVNDPSRALVVADFFRGRPIEDHPALVLLRDFGNGVALFTGKGS